MGPRSHSGAWQLSQPFAARHPARPAGRGHERQVAFGCASRRAHREFPALHDGRAELPALSNLPPDDEKRNARYSVPSDVGVAGPFSPRLGEGREDVLAVAQIPDNSRGLLLVGVGGIVAILVLPAEDPLLGAPAEGIIAEGQLAEGRLVGGGSLLEQDTLSGLAGETPHS